MSIASLTAACGEALWVMWLSLVTRHHVVKTVMTFMCKRLGSFSNMVNCQNIYRLEFMSDGVLFLPQLSIAALLYPRPLPQGYRLSIAFPEGQPAAFQVVSFRGSHRRPCRAASLTINRHSALLLLPGGERRLVAGWNQTLQAPSQKPNLPDRPSSSSRPLQVPPSSQKGEAIWE